MYNTVVSYVSISLRSGVFNGRGSARRDALESRRLISPMDFTYQLWSTPETVALEGEGLFPC